MRFLYPSAFALAAFVVPAAFAHDLWLEPTTSGLALRYGHHALASHEGATDLRYSPDAVASAVCLDAGGQRQPAVLGRSYPATLTGDCSVAYVLMSTGYWTKTAAGTKNISKIEAAAPLGSWQSLESVKHVIAWGPGAGSPVGAPLEIVPAENPLALLEGDKLTVRVVADGAPVADVTVSYDGKPRGQTGADGTVNVRIKHGGLQLIQASTRTPHAGPEADEVVHTTALTFDLGGGQ